MPLSPATATPCHWFPRLATALDPRSAPRLVRLFLGAVLAQGRRTVTSWLRAAGITGAFRPAYTTVAAAGKRADLIAARVAHDVVRPLVADADRLTWALDDTPTERYGRHVQGAGIHHNPSPGPAGSPFVYGHLGVVLGLLATPPAWGVIALPLRARLYVRAKALPAIGPAHRPPFRTKLERAVERLRWAVAWLGHWGKPWWLVTDGAYAKAALRKPLRSLGVTVVSRLRKDAALWSVPGPRRPGQRGRRRHYGERRIALANRAGQRRGWRSGTFDRYGEPTRKRYQTFLATGRPAGGLIRVVLVDEPTGGRAYFCTDPAASVADILGIVADRFALETTFRDGQEVLGAGPQQVRFVWASIGSFHLCLWAFTLTEAWAWGRKGSGLVDRSARPWDDPARRPSHADKRRAGRRELLGQEIRAALRAGPSETEITAAVERLLNLAAYV